MTDAGFGGYGGQYVPEALMPAIDELEEAYERYLSDPEFVDEFESRLRDYGGRPTPLYHAPTTSERVGAEVYLKREDLLHGGAHKLNNALGQALLAKKMGKRRIIAETGAGQHGTATAMAAAALDLDCEIYMGEKDIERQKPNVFRMRLMGADVVPVEAGTGTLKDAINETLRDWATNVEDTHYVIGSIVGPHPFPSMVRDFQAVIGREIREQAQEKEGRLPDSVVACAGGGSNTMGAFHAFRDDDVDLYAVEAGGSGLELEDDRAPHSASLNVGEEGVLHGARTRLLQDDDGQILESHSLSAGLDYSGVGPELAHLVETGHVEARTADDDEAMEAFHTLSREEGIIPALESAHAVALLEKEEDLGELVVVNVSGRGDKDLDTVMAESELADDGSVLREEGDR